MHGTAAVDVILLDQEVVVARDSSPPLAMLDVTAAGIWKNTIHKQYSQYIYLRYMPILIKVRFFINSYELL